MGEGTLRRRVAENGHLVIAFGAVEEDDRLSAAFRAEFDLCRRDGQAEAAAVAAVADLEGDLRRAHDRGRAQFPSIDLDEETFARHLARVLAREGFGAADLANLAIEDLFLVSACLAKDPSAVTALRARHGTTIRQAVDRTARGRDAGEIEQQVWDGMLVGSADTPARIGSYAGRAPLDRWLQVAAQRTALMWLRSNKAEARAHQGAAAEALLAPHTHPEVGFFKARYRGEFAQALTEGLGRMGERDRALLRLSLVNGLSVDKIGKMFGVSQPTAS